jgi:hypothetical protein
MIRKELLTKLRSKIGESKIKRSSKEVKKNILDKGLKEMGIDQEKFKEDLEKIKKQGGLELNFNQ